MGPTDSHSYTRDLPLQTPNKLCLLHCGQRQIAWLKARQHGTELLKVKSVRDSSMLLLE